MTKKKTELDPKKIIKKFKTIGCIADEEPRPKPSDTQVIRYYIQDLEERIHYTEIEIRSITYENEPKDLSKNKEYKVLTKFIKNANQLVQDGLSFLKQEKVKKMIEDANYPGASYYSPAVKKLIDCVSKLSNEEYRLIFEEDL